MSGNSKLGRPRGTGYDDSAMIAAIAAYMAEHPGVSVRAAISRCLDRGSQNFDADLRRLQRKLALQDSAPCTKDLLEQPFEYGPMRRTAMWGCHVDVPVEGVDGIYGITQSVVVGRPILLVVCDDKPVDALECLDHPLFKAVNALPQRHGFDHPDYRLICETVGIDPDRSRPPFIEAYEEAVDLLMDSIKDRDGLPEHRKRALYAGLGLFHDTKFCPEYLHDVLELETDPERRKRILDQAVAVMRTTDWSSEHMVAAVRMLATPWGYKHESSIWVGAAPNGKLPSGSIIDMPIFLKPPHPHDLAGRMAALLYERNLCAVVLSPEELEAWNAGGDSAHWLRVGDWFASASEKGRPAECDLSMTRALRESLISTAYDGYVARNASEPFDPQGLLSYERDDRSTPPSKPLHSRRTSLPAIAHAVSWHASRIFNGLRATFLRRGKATTRMVRIWGGHLAITVYENGEAVIRPGRTLPRLNRRRVEISVTFGHRSREIAAIPKIHHQDFRMTFVDTGECLPKAFALPMLAELEAIAMWLPIPKSGEVLTFETVPAATID